MFLSHARLNQVDSMYHQHIHLLVESIQNVKSAKVANSTPTCRSACTTSTVSLYFLLARKQFAITIASSFLNVEKNNHNCLKFIFLIHYKILDGVYGSFNCNLYDHKIVHPITLKSADEEVLKFFFQTFVFTMRIELCILFLPISLLSEGIQKLHLGTDM